MKNVQSLALFAFIGFYVRKVLSSGSEKMRAISIIWSLFNKLKYLKMVYIQKFFAHAHDGRSNQIKCD